VGVLARSKSLDLLATRPVRAPIFDAPPLKTMNGREGTVKAVRRLSERWRGTITKLIEDKANGSAVIQLQRVKSLA
jgi:hypothetical protein